jgi:oxygen-dependent protoporphyrinogen oxidase
MAKPLDALRTTHHVVIVGAGITGLAAAYFVQKAHPDAAITVLEAGARIGGKVQSERVEGPGGGYLLERGADAFLARQKPWAYELALTLGLEDELLPTLEQNSGVYVVYQGRLERLPRGLQLIIPTDWDAFNAAAIMSGAGKARLAQEPTIPRRAEEGDESVADFVTRRMGREALERLAEPFLSGIYSALPEEQSLLATFPRFAQMERLRGSLLAVPRTAPPSPQGSAPKQAAATTFVSFKEGTERLARALAEALRGEVRLNSPVTGMTRSGEGYRLALADGETLGAQQVILTLPARQAAPLLRDVAPDALSSLHELRTVSSGVVYLAYRAEEIPHPLDAFGAVVPRIEGRACNALTFVTSKFAGRAPEGYRLIRYFFGGARTPHLMELDDAELIATARAELADLLGVHAQPGLSHVVRWWHAQPQYDVGHLDRMARIQTALPSGIALIGTTYGGVGIPDCVRQAQEVGEQGMKRTGD